MPTPEPHMINAEFIHSVFNELKNGPSSSFIQDITNTYPCGNEVFLTELYSKMEHLPKRDFQTVTPTTIEKISPTPIVEGESDPITAYDKAIIAYDKAMKVIE